MKNGKKVAITICLGSSCFARGNSKVLEVVKSYLQQNKVDGSLSFKGELCQEHCSKGPVIQINNVEYYEVSASNVIDILNKHI